MADCHGGSLLVCSFSGQAKMDDDYGAGLRCLGRHGGCENMAGPLRGGLLVIVTWNLGSSPFLRRVICLYLAALISGRSCTALTLILSNYARARTFGFKNGCLRCALKQAQLASQMRTCYDIYWWLLKNSIDI